jgi:hypothetical protein
MAGVVLADKGNDMQATLNISLTPEQLAEAWWGMGSKQQAAFYAHLHRIAGFRLCMQAAWITHEIVETDNADARDGWQTLHGHASEYIKTAIDIRAGNALREIRRGGA